MFALTPDAQAGMTVYGLNEVYRLRVQELSFFVFLLLLCTVAFRFLWNTVAKDLPRIPRLGWRQASCLSVLLGVLMLLVLTMISGIREVLTPEAWRKQGTSYKLNSAEQEPVRKRAIEDLRYVLFAYADAHDGQFPKHDFTGEIPGKFWEAPDRLGSRFIYVGALKKTAEGETPRILAVEPPNFGEERFAIFTDGEIRQEHSDEIQTLLGNSGTKGTSYDR